MYLSLSLFSSLSVSLSHTTYVVHIHIYTQHTLQIIKFLCHFSFLLLLIPPHLPHSLSNSLHHTCLFLGRLSKFYFCLCVDSYIFFFWQYCEFIFFNYLKCLKIYYFLCIHDVFCEGCIAVWGRRLLHWVGIKLRSPGLQGAVAWMSLGWILWYLKPPFYIGHSHLFTFLFLGLFAMTVTLPVSKNKWILPF